LDAENNAPLVVVGSEGTLVMSDGSVITGNNNTTSGAYGYGWQRLLISPHKRRWPYCHSSRFFVVAVRSVSAPAGLHGLCRPPEKA